MIIETNMAIEKKNISKDKKIFLNIFDRKITKKLLVIS